MKTETFSAGLALGSNVGDRVSNLKAARDRLRALHQGDPEAFLVSPIYETAPVGCAPGTPAFLNAMVQLESALDPLALLDAAQTIERDLGRPDRRAKNAPRTIDVDLLYVGESTMANERLELPHPRMLDRLFVLIPLTDLLGDQEIPGLGVSATEGLAKLNSDEPVPERFLDAW